MAVAGTEDGVRSLPPGVEAARGRLFGEDEVFFVPVRHHSPACAFALRALLRELRPAAVLIEGPDDLGALLPLLGDERTRAPVAWLCHSTRQVPQDDPDADEKTRTESRSSFFPFCDYSPEWIAVREGAALGAQVALIDLPWRDKAWQRDDDERDEDAGDARDAARSLMEERHFAHSRYLNAMAAQLGCVDHQELWDRLFELRGSAALADWRSFFRDVFSWCAMARLDYEPEVLEAELSLPRERHMAAHVRRWRDAVKGPIVVVTGGFHTPELLARWRDAKPSKAAGSKDGAAEAWLIRYSFERLDALNGYAAGMPSPGYYQQVWERLDAGDADPFAAVALDSLVRFARRTRAQDHADAVSTALVQAAAAQAMRLAALRGNAGPGRQDLLDAIRSCFVKGAIDEGTRGFTADLRQFLSGTRIGDVPPSAGSPPLIEDARRLARRAGVRLDDSTARVARLDLYRKPSHRERSRFFHAMAYLDAGLAAWLAGPDFIGNSRLNLLFEEWRAAWSPLVEARLIELAAEGASVEAVCMARLRKEEAALAAEGRGRSASAAVTLLLRACLIGLQPRLPQLLAMLSTHLDEDAALGSVVDCGHRLVTLWRAREPLGVQQHPQLRHLLGRVWPAALFLLPDIGPCGEDAEADAVKQLLSLRELGRLLDALQHEIAQGEGEDGGAGEAVDPGLLRAQFERFATGAPVAPGVAGAASALLYLDGHWDEHALDTVVRQRFGAGAEPREAVRFLNGVMAAAPELLLRLPALLEGLDGLVRGWDAEAFVAHLPDLRQAFTRLKPQETADLAGRVAALHGADEAAVAALQQMHYETTEEDLQQGALLQLALAECLRRDGLGAWLDGGP
ncbi:hypothetical protein M2165_002312 [Variovorax sp. TBS-050B]|uniref:DUF5682 family protein n=1 Tax=Variovorax sp. TBS-050B TaxID=2940551 RepID=UPI0024734A42|nr:DUF5682 family protein [Variovorax sp. TBS-050B]MDH6592423.1 hypothetical protein [Variovorax sp. TBS-050B]